MGDDSPNVVLVFESIDANRSIDTIRLIGPAWAYTAGELATAKTRTLDIKPPPDEIDAVFALLMQGDPLLIAMNGAARADKK